MVLRTSLLSVADANKEIEAITKPNKIPDNVDTAEAIGCISLLVKLDITGQENQQIKVVIAITIQW